MIKQGDIESVKILVESDKELLFAETPFGTWLEVASALNKIELVQYFISCGIDINKCCGISNGGPIESAAFKGNLDIVKMLYENGAVLDVSTAEKTLYFQQYIIIMLKLLNILWKKELIYLQLMQLEI